MPRALLHEWHLRWLAVFLALLLASCSLEADTNATAISVDEQDDVATSTSEPAVTTTAPKATTTTTTTSAPATTTAPETTQASMSFPITFAGPGTMTFTTDQMGASGACVMEQLLTVTLLPDGSVGGKIEGEALAATTIEQVEGVNTLVCLDRNDFVADLIGSHDSGEVELRIAESPDQPFLEGKYEPDQLTVDQEKVNQVTGDVTVTNWALFEFELPPQSG